MATRVLGVESTLKLVNFREYGFQDERQTLEIIMKIVSRLSSEEYFVFIELLKKYQCFDILRINDELKKLLLNTEKQLPKGNGKLYLLSGSTVAKSSGGSGPMMDYMAYSLIRNLGKYAGHDVQDISRVIDTATIDDRVILIDDFSGTGDTIIDTISDIKLKYAIDTSQIVVLIIAAQRTAYEAIKNENVTCYCGNLYSKAIVDDVALSKSVHQDVYDKMVVSFCQDVHYMRGYMGSEALVSFLRTADNTLPIFWKPMKRGGGECAAIFPR